MWVQGLKLQGIGPVKLAMCLTEHGAAWNSIGSVDLILGFGQPPAAQIEPRDIQWTRARRETIV